MSEFLHYRKDIDRVRRACGVDRNEAVRLLALYGGKPERVMMEHFGAVRVYVEPVSVRDPLAEARAARNRIVSACLNARLTVTQGCRAVASLPLLPALLTALAVAPAAAVLMLMALLAGYRFGVNRAEEFETV